MKKDVLEKWNNTCIKVLSVEHGKQVINFWKSVGVETNMTGNAIGDYYGLFDGKFNEFTNEKYWCKAIIITLEEAIAIRDGKNKTFPREMYVWDFHIKSAEKRMVYFIVDKSIKTDQPVLVVDGEVSLVYTDAMEIEEYESIMKNHNTELIKQIERTEKELSELKSKLIWKKKF